MNLFNSLKDKTASTIEDAVRYKFQSIKNLSVSVNESGYTISFVDDGKHTKEMVDSFLTELFKPV